MDCVRIPIEKQRDNKRWIEWKLNRNEIHKKKNRKKEKLYELYTNTSETKINTNLLLLLGSVFTSNLNTKICFDFYIEWMPPTHVSNWKKQIKWTHLQIIDDKRKVNNFLNWLLEIYNFNRENLLQNFILFQNRNF